MFKHQLIDTSRGRIVSLLQHGGLTADELAVKLALTPNAVRVQLTAMERDAVVQRAGRKPGTTRPSHIFELTAEVEQLLSQAYVPFLTHLVELLSASVPVANVDRLMRDVGKALAKELPAIKLPTSLAGRVTAASEVLNQHLGAVTHVEANGSYMIRGVSCPLAAVTGKQAAVCLAIESLVGEIVGADAHECCDRTGRPKCCFRIETQGAESRKKRSR